jgi:septum formation protein
VKKIQVFKTIKPLILASKSPRRRRYFEDLGLDFTVQTADIPEIIRPGEKPGRFVKRLAGEKAAAVMRDHPKSWVVAADTVVCFSGIVLGKPKDADDAVAMLMRLSGRRHSVLTGFCLGCVQEDIRILEAVTTSVAFSDFTEEIARAYVATGEPLDKAGAYGIQGRGAFLVRTLSGSYSNVVGLPLHEVSTKLFQYGVIASVS